MYVRSFENVKIATWVQRGLRLLAIADKGMGHVHSLDGWTFRVVSDSMVAWHMVMADPPLGRPRKSTADAIQLAVRALILSYGMEK